MEWAQNHINKHDVSVKEAWEVVFENNPKPIPLRAPEQLNFPPYIRYWTIGKTKKKRVLFVAWEKHRETLNLITAFEPNKKRIEIYEKIIKKTKYR
ncbi:MAG: BrnT family toxin [Bacteriovoracaceae bacterium]|nr:BrnT family toxin [Bacteriovoracaceae bacterium]